MASYDANYRESYLGGPTWTVEHYNPKWTEQPVERYVSLPHQCGEWRIGDVADIEALIADLQALIADPPALRTASVDGE